MALYQAQICIRIAAQRATRGFAAVDEEIGPRFWGISKEWGTGALYTLVGRVRLPGGSGNCEGYNDDNMSRP
jgi:hypothetical protein